MVSPKRKVGCLGFSCFAELHTFLMISSFTDFLTLSSYSTVLGDDDSSSVVTDGGFRFGTGSVNYVHVSIYIHCI